MDYEQYKKLLEEELETVKTELESVGRVNPENPKDWEPTEGDHPVENPAESGEKADHVEEYEERTAILKQLEIRWNDIKMALGKIEDGSYGKCEICEKEIEAERLEANPAATTCINHMTEEKEA